MMEKITISKVNETYLRVECETCIKYEMEEYFKFEIPNAKWNPKVKAGFWDGYIKLFSIYKSLLYVGLLGQLRVFCEQYEYELVEEESDYGLPSDKEKITPAELAEFVKSLNLPVDKEVRDYQYIAAYKAIKNRRHIIISPTASGKSLTIYIIIRYLLEMGSKVLLVVPTTSLVAQMTNDFHEYSEGLGYDVDAMIQEIYSGKEKNRDVPITISTWQSIFRLPKSWFSQFDCAICDEVHLGKAQSLSTIMENCTEATHKIGLTGSLDNSKTHKQMLTSLYGEIIRVASTRDLIDKGFLSNININCLLLKYSKETSAIFKKVSYQKEMDFIVSHEARNRFIRNLALSLKGNTLILFNYVEKHGKIIFDDLVSKDPSREVYFVHGGTDVDDRESARYLTEKGEDVIIVASMGVFSTGVNIKRLHNVILASPTKSVIRVLQSIGRGLRKAHDKDMFELYDIADDLTVTRSAKKNHTFEHFKERLRIYSNEEFQYKITEVEIE